MTSKNTLIYDKYYLDYNLELKIQSYCENNLRSGVDRIYQKDVYYKISIWDLIKFWRYITYGRYPSDILIHTAGITVNGIYFTESAILNNPDYLIGWYSVTDIVDRLIKRHKLEELCTTPISRKKKSIF